MVEPALNLANVWPSGNFEVFVKKRSVRLLLVTMVFSADSWSCLTVLVVALFLVPCRENQGNPRKWDYRMATKILELAVWSVCFWPPKPRNAGCSFRLTWSLLQFAILTMLTYVNHIQACLKNTSIVFWKRNCFSISPMVCHHLKRIIPHACQCLHFLVDFEHTVRQGLLNYPFWWDQTRQVYGSFEGFPTLIVALFKLVI